MNPEMLRRLVAHARWLAARHPTDLPGAVRESAPRVRVRAGHADLAALLAAMVAVVVAVAVAAIPPFDQDDPQVPQAASPRPSQLASPSAEDSENPTESFPPETAAPSRTKPPSASRSSARAEPFVLRAAREGTDAVRLTWQEPAGFRVTGYEVWRSDRLVGRVDADTTRYRMGKLRDGDYDVFVVAVGDARSRRSNTVRVSIDNPRPPDPTQPTPTPSTTP